MINNFKTKDKCDSGEDDSLFAKVDQFIGNTFSKTSLYLYIESSSEDKGQYPFEFFLSKKDTVRLRDYLTTVIDNNFYETKDGNWI